MRIIIFHRCSRSSFISLIKNCMLKAITILTMLIMATMSVYAQNLSGTWVGGGGGTEVKIVLLKSGNHYVGYTYDHDAMGFCKTNFIAEYDTANMKLKGKSVGFIDHTFLHAQTNYNLRYSTSFGREVLKGTASPRSAGTKILSLGIPIGVTLRKESDYADTTSFMYTSLNKVSEVSNVTAAVVKTDTLTTSDELKGGMLTAPGKDTAAFIAAIQERTNPIIETITTSSSRIFVKMYDNGVEDGDSISILYNNRVIRSGVAVTTKPVVFALLLTDTNIDHDSTLVAQNVGSIPPNTAMIEIQAGTKNYTISASADLHRNAIIRIKYKTE